METLFRALADRTRLRLLNLMGNDEVCVCYFVEILRTLLGEMPGASVADWPIDYPDLAPFYDWVEQTMGVSGHFAAGQVGAPFPLPPLTCSPLAAFLDRGAAAHGADLFATPRSVLSRSYGGRPGCNYCGFCGSYGCSTNAKGSARAALLNPAIANGNCKITPNAMVYKLESDNSGKVTSAKYYDEMGNSRSVSAKLFIVACQAEPEQTHGQTGQNDGEVGSPMSPGGRAG